VKKLDVQEHNQFKTFAVDNQKYNVHPQAIMVALYDQLTQANGKAVLQRLKHGHAPEISA
jgi:hypothetical protein